MSKLERMAATPPVVMPDENMDATSCGRPESMSGTSSTLSPSEKLTAMTSTSFRPIFCDAMMRIPAVATVPNISSVAPPSTGSGISENTRLTAGNSPSSTRNSAMKYPTYLLATQVSCIMPLFWANMELGKELNTAAMNEVRPFATTPPDTRLSNTLPSTGSPDISELAVMSP